MDSLIPSKVKTLWNGYNIRVFILLSLSCQIFLVLFAPFRKRTRNKFVIICIWAAYLLADWTAAFTVGLISNNQEDTTFGSENTGDLLAFWTPFLLLHLGGPDTITSFALEDNELWLRHLLGLIFQVGASVYVFSQSLPNELWVPTVLLFLAGIIKFAERTFALYRASVEGFRAVMLAKSDPGPNYAKLMDLYNAKRAAEVPKIVEMEPMPDVGARMTSYTAVREGDLNDIEVVQRAYNFFQIFKGLVVDLTVSYNERNASREFLLMGTAEDSFRLIEVELNFIYEVLFTKFVIVHSLAGYIFRCISFTSVLVALVVFYSKEKHGYKKFDIRITYTLLLGAIALDFIAFIMLIISDWTIVLLQRPRRLTLKILSKYLAIKRSRWLRFFFRRWSEYVSTYNLIDYCVKESSRLRRVNADTKHFGLSFILDKIRDGFGKFSDNLGFKAFSDEIKYVHNIALTEQLRKFIFEELKMKSEVADQVKTAKEIGEARGGQVLRSNGLNTLVHWIDEVDYDKSLLLWHFATELCYNTDGGVADCYREYSKILSDYMLYLLIMQPKLMSAVVGIGQSWFQDTCTEANKFFGSRELEKGNEQLEACRKIMNVNTDVAPVAVKGDRSKSMLFEAVVLAKELNNITRRDKWEIISKVWVELLSYAASHCRADAHAQQVSNGGELVSFVWLLMVHFGLGDQFQINGAHGRAEFIMKTASLSL